MMGAHQEFEAVSGQKSLCGFNCSAVKCCFFYGRYDAQWVTMIQAVASQAIVPNTDLQDLANDYHVYK